MNSKQLRRNDNIARIRLGYDALKDMNLKGNTRESEEAKPDGYPDIINIDYEVSLSLLEEDWILHLKHHLKTMVY